MLKVVVALGLVLGAALSFGSSLGGTDLPTHAPSLQAGDEVKIDRG